MVPQPSALTSALETASAGLTLPRASRQRQPALSIRVLGGWCRLTTQRFLLALLQVADTTSYTTTDLPPSELPTSEGCQVLATGQLTPEALGAHPE